jgi:hypothetical protein
VSGRVTTSTVPVTVSQNLTTVSVSPASAEVALNGTQLFTASGSDQFGQGMNPQPVFAWSLVGAGTVDGTGFYTASSSGTATLTATSGGKSAAAAIVVNSPPTVAAVATATPAVVSGSSTQLTVLGADDGGEAALSYAWATTGVPPAAVAFSANNSNAAKNSTATFTKSGNYAIQATISDVGTLAVTSSLAVEVNIPPVNTVPPQVIVSGFAAGDTLTADPGTWTDSTGTAVTHAYQWQRADSAAGDNAVDIPGAIAVQYVLTAADNGKHIRVIVTATDPGAPTPALASAVAATDWAAVNYATFTLTLTKGWNLISLPVQPVDPQPSA